VAVGCSAVRIRGEFVVVLASGGAQARTCGVPTFSHDMQLDLNDEELGTLAARLHEKLSPLLARASTSPWMQFKEAVAYSRIPAGTFRRLSAMGLIPSHGGRTKLYHRDEIDEAILSGRACLTPDGGPLPAR
jgi:hypothetical protein